MSSEEMAGELSAWAELVDNWWLFRDPLLCAAVAGGVLGFLSAYVVMRRMVFLSAAVTQASGLGVALAFYSGIHLGFEVEPAYGAVLLSFATAGLLAVDPRRIGLTREGVLGIVFAFGGGAAVLVGSRITQEAHDIQAILFGTGVLVEPADLGRVLVAGALVMTVHVWWFRGLTFASFDPVAARVQGLPVRLLDVALLMSIGLMVGVSARALGALPVFALSTLPATAVLVSVRANLPMTFALAALIGALCATGGYLWAFFREFPVGGSQTVLAVAVAAVAVLWRLLSSWLGRR